MLDLRNPLQAITIGGLTLLLLPIPSPVSSLISGVAPRLEAQASSRMRRPSTMPQPEVPPTPVNPQPNAMPSPQAPGAITPASPGQFSAAPPTAALPPSLLQQPAKPAQIQFSDSTLSIAADNSSLSEILRTVASQSGMQIEGLGADERVFGSFGPGKPRDVLSTLLNGTPYNIMMVGDQSNGAPDKLILTPTAPETQTATSSAPAPVQAVAPPADEDDTDASDALPRPEPLPRGQLPPGFGQGPSNDSTPPQAAKTPQQLFEELLAMRQKQQQQQDSQQQK